MRKYIIIGLFLAVNIAFAAYNPPPSTFPKMVQVPEAVANMNFGVIAAKNAGGAPAACGLDTDEDLAFTYMWGDTDESFEGSYEAAIKFTVASELQVTQYVVRSYVEYDLGVTYDPIFSIQADSGSDYPGSSDEAGSTVTLDITTMNLDTTYRDIVIELPAAITLSSGDYWLVMTVGSAGENYLKIARDNSSTGARICFKNSGTWADSSKADNYTDRSKIFGCP